MTREDEAFMADRAEALAVVALTRRDDIHLCRGPRWSGYDISAELLSDGVPTGRVFAVQVVPTESELTKAQVQRLLRKETTRTSGKHQIDLPFMTLLADVVRDDVRFLWQPTAETGGNTQHIEARKLDAHALDEVVESVQEWYSKGSPRRVA
jgi:hypothetical protein